MGYIASSTDEHTEIRTLLSKVNAQEDPRQGYALVQKHIASIRSRGQKVPDELRRMEKVLVTELCAESQGR